MTEPFADFAELRALLDALCEEIATAEQLRRLEELILAHPEAEAYYVQCMSQHAELVRWFAAPAGSPAEALRRRLHEASQPGQSAEQPASGPARSRGRRWVIAGALGLAGIAAAVLIALNLWGPRAYHRRIPGERPEATDATVAVLLQAPGAQWEDTGLPTRVGAPLPPGWLRLKAGFAHLEFYSGATVILQGPAELKLISRTEAYCARGKLRASVPPQAQGFRIGSPRLDLVDRGTEFGLEVDGGERTDVHVFKGKVELYDLGADETSPARRALTTGEGVRVDGPGNLRPIPLDSSAFLTAQELARRSLDEAKARQAQWKAASAEWRQDPGLVVYYPFEPDPPLSRMLSDKAAGRQQTHDGAIVGCSWVEGRWPGKQALEFKQVCDRVRIHVPGELRSLTLAAWVRVDSLPNLNNSLMMADAWKEGGVHWQIGEGGKLVFAVRARDKVPNAHYHAPGVFRPERLGKWTHLAVVYDADAHMVTHYVDGRAEAVLPIVLDEPLRIGNAELGNWNTDVLRSAQPIRFLSGCMDEFMLFSRPLTGEDIERLYNQGRPMS